MRQATMTAPGVIRVGDAAEPVCKPGQVLLRIHRIGVCGSDVHVYHGKHPYTSYPVVQGHEFSATVQARGADVREPLHVGQRVTAMPQLVCGSCGPCRRGMEYICDHLRVMGFQAPGVAQDLFAIDAEKVVPLPDAFTFEMGALVEPTAVAVHAVGRAGDVAGRNVVVLGAGPIGNLVAQVAGAKGAAGVLITDLSKWRLNVAKQCGVAHNSVAGEESLSDAAVRAFGDAGFDAALECVGVEATIGQAIEAINKGGRIVVVGVFGEKPAVDLGLVQDRELTLAGTLMYQRRDYEQAIALLSEGKVRHEPLLGRHFPLEDYLAAYEHIEQAGDKTMKVFIDL